MTDDNSIRFSGSDGTVINGDEDSTLAVINDPLSDFETFVELLSLRDCPSNVKAFLAKS